MSSNDIRLRLTIRRHALPEVRLVWPCTASEDLTIANLLSQVNDVVTLESGQWGLEDYTVELADGQGGSFECLHFQQINKVFKHDDQVIIRSLLTDDIRRRRISGRHQISGDGIHLVDGIPFGRRRVPRNRPIFKLPPRKRARITYDSSEDEADDEEDQPAQLQLEGSLTVDGRHSRVAALNTVHDDDDDDEDFVPTADYEDYRLPDGDEEDLDDDSDADGEELGEELRLLRADNDVDTKESKRCPGNANGDGKSPVPRPSTGRSSPQPLLQEIAPAATTALRAAFPLLSPASVENTLQRNNTDLHQSFVELAASNDPALTFDEVLHGFLIERFQPDAAPEPRLLPEAPKTSSKPLIQEVESDGPDVDTTNDPTQTSTHVIGAATDQHDTSDDTSSSGDSSSESGGASSSEDESEMSKDGDEVYEDARMSSDESSDSDFEGLSSDGSDASDSAQNDSEKDVQGGVSGESSASNDSESDSSDSSSGNDSSSSSEDSNSESAPEEVSTRPTPSSLPASKQPVGKREAQSTDAEAGGMGLTDVSQTMTVGRGQGLTRTQKRNARRKMAKRLMAAQSGKATSEEDLMARKQALLDAVAYGTSNEKHATTNGGDGSERPADMILSQTGLDDERNASKTNTEGATEVGGEGQQSPACSTSEDTPKRPSRIDMGASKRLLFGALGLKNPKTKADEEKLKQELMKDVRPLKPHSRAVAEPENSADAEMADPETIDDYENWRDKITYRAVECWDEDIVLSEPPFPFVQRWDPQQQYNPMRKRKRNSQEFHEDAYDEGDSFNFNDDNGDDSTAGHKSSKKKRQAAHRYGDQAAHRQNLDADAGLNYDDIRNPEESNQSVEMDDLPPLPKDIAALPALSIDAINPGMVITWKQLRLSKATKWEPQVLSVTGLVVSITDNQVLHLVLAKRDRESNDKVYDEETGKRIYEKFEAPEDSGEEDDEDSHGHVYLSWNEIMDPRLVQGEPTPSELATPAKDRATSDQGAMQVTGYSGSGVEHPQAPGSASGEPACLQMMMDTKEDLANVDGREDEDPQSFSIPSGQNISRLDTDAPSVGKPSYSGSSKGDTSQDKPIYDGDVVIRDSQPPEAGGNTTTQLSLNRPEIPVRPLVTEVPESADGNAGDEDSQLVMAVGQTQDQEGFPEGSSQSGRQPPSNHGLSDTVNPMDITISPEKSIGGSKLEPPNGQTLDSSSALSSSPFPSIDEIWHTAHTSKLTRSPLKSSQTSALAGSKVGPDAEYQEAMQKLDEGEGESDSFSDENNTSIRSLFPNSTQPAESTKTEGPSSETRRSSRRRKPTSPFRLPEGSQVLTLSSSSPSPDRSADRYSADEPEQESPLPNGSGWVQKVNGRKEQTTPKETRSRRKSMPAAETTGSGKKARASSAGQDPVRRRRASRKF